MNQVAGATGQKHELEVAPRIHRAFWSKKLIKPGEKSALLIQTENVKDGTAVDVTLITMGGPAGVKPKTTELSGKIQKNLCSLEWTADLDGLDEEGKCPLVPVTMLVKIGVLPVLFPGQNFLAVANYGALLDSVDPSFCPGAESLRVRYSILDPFKFVRSGVLRIYGNQVEGKSYPDESAVVYQRLLAPHELTTGSHEIEWQGFCNAESGPFAGEGESDVRYVNPLYSPYVVDVQLLDRVVQDPTSWPQDDALPSLPTPGYADFGLNAVGDAAEVAPEGSLPAHAGFEIAIEDLALELGDWVESESTMPSGADATAQYRLNQLGYFCGPVDGKVGPLTRKGFTQFKRTHYSVPENPDEKREPLGDPDTAKVDATLDEKTNRAIAEEDTPRTWLRVLESDGTALEDEEGRPVVNRLPDPSEKGRIVVDGSVFYQEGTEFWDSSKKKPGVKKQDRDAEWIPRPWIPVEARPRLRNRNGRAASADESRLGCLGLRVLWRVVDPEAQYEQYDLPEDEFTGLAHRDHEIKTVTLPSIDTNKGVKYRLLRLGFRPGDIDDDLDADAKGAIRTFQSDWALTADGKLTDETRAKIDEVHGNSNSESLWEIGAKYGLSSPQVILDDPLNSDVEGEITEWHDLPVGKTLKIPPFENFTKYKAHKDGKPRDFLRKTVDSYKGTVDGDWMADNAPDEVEGKPNYGVRVHDEKRRGTEALRHFDKFFPLSPWQPEEVDDTRAGRGKMLATRMATKGPKRGRTGLYFVPGILGGDDYRIEAWVDLEKGPDGSDLPNSVWLGGRYPEGAPVGRTGHMTVWREVVLSEYLYIRDRTLEPDHLAQADWDRFQEIYRHAAVELRLPADSKGKEISEADYQRLVAHAYGCEPTSVELAREQLYPRLASGLTEEQKSSHPLALPEQEKLSDSPVKYEDAGAYYSKIKDKISDFHSNFATAMGTQWEREHRTGATIVDFRRNLAYTPIRKTNGDLHPEGAIRSWLEKKFLSTGQAKGVLLMDQRDPDKAHYVWAHELGHSLFLYHWKNTGENNTEDHDNDDDYCVMMYPGKGEAAKIDPDFCGKCLLKLRGWNEKALPATAPSGSGASAAKSGAGALDTSGCEDTGSCEVVNEGLRLREQLLLALDKRQSFESKKKRLEAAHFVRQVAENAASSKSSYADDVWPNMLAAGGNGDASSYEDSYLKEDLESLESEEKGLTRKVEDAIVALVDFLRREDVQKHLVEHHASRVLPEADAKAVYETERCSAELGEYRELDHLLATLTEHLSESATGREFLGELIDPSKVPSHPAFSDLWGWVGKVKAVSEPVGKFLYNTAPVMVFKAQELGATAKIATIDDILADPDLARHFRFLKEKTGVDVPGYLSQRAHAIEDQLVEAIAKADAHGKTVQKLDEFENWFSKTDEGKRSAAMKKLDGAWAGLTLDLVSLALSSSKVMADARSGKLKFKDALGLLNDTLGASKTAVETYQAVLQSKLGQGADTAEAGTRILRIERAEKAVKVMGKFAAVIGVVVGFLSLVEGIKRRDAGVIVTSLAAMFTSVVAFFAPASWSGVLAVVGLIIALLTVLILDPKIIDYLEDTPWGEHSGPGRKPVIAVDKVIDTFYSTLFALSVFVSRNSLDAELSSITIRSALLRDGLPVSVEVKRESDGESLGRFSVDPGGSDVDGKGRVVKHALSWAGASNVARTIHVLEPWEIWPDIVRDGDTAYAVRVRFDPDRDMEFEFDEKATGVTFPPHEPPKLVSFRKDGLFAAGMNVIWKSSTPHLVHPKDAILRVEYGAQYANGCKVRVEAIDLTLLNETVSEAVYTLHEEDFDVALRLKDPADYDDGEYDLDLVFTLFDRNGDQADRESVSMTIVSEDHARAELGWSG